MTPPTTAPVAAPRPALPPLAAPIAAPPPAPTAPPSSPPTSAPLAVSATGSNPVCCCAHDSQPSASCAIRSMLWPFAGAAYTFGRGGAVAHPVAMTAITTPVATSRFMGCPPGERTGQFPCRTRRGVEATYGYTGREVRGHCRRQALGHRQRDNRPRATVSADPRAHFRRF